MDISKECDQATAEATGDEWKVSVDQTDWEQTCQKPDGGHVSALINISEEASLREQEPYEFPFLAGWQHAIQGWGRDAPLACLLQSQRRGKGAKPGDPDQHCLLCVDMKCCKPLHSPSSGRSHVSSCKPILKDSLKRSHRSNCSVQYHHASAVSYSRSPRIRHPSPEWEPPPDPPSVSGLQKAMQQLSLPDKVVEENSAVSYSRSPRVSHPSPERERPPDPPSVSGLQKAIQQLSLPDKVVEENSAVSYSRSPRVSHPSPERERPPDPPSVSGLQKAIQQLSLPDKVVEEKVELRELSEPLSLQQPSVALSQPQHLATDCTTFSHSSGENPTLIINSFSVLPPVRASQTKQIGVPCLSSEAAAVSSCGREKAEAKSGCVVTPAEERLAEKVERTVADSVPDAGVSNDTYHRVVTSNYSPHNHLLRHKMFSSFRLPKRHGTPLSYLVKLPSYPASPLVKQESYRTSTGHCLALRAKNYLGLKAKSMRGTEPQLPILLGTRVHNPASAHRLL